MEVEKGLGMAGWGNGNRPFRKVAAAGSASATKVGRRAEDDLREAWRRRRERACRGAQATPSTLHDDHRICLGRRAGARDTSPWYLPMQHLQLLTVSRRSHLRCRSYTAHPGHSSSRGNSSTSFSTRGIWNGDHRTGPSRSDMAV
jgi:hypothetical protein